MKIKEWKFCISGIETMLLMNSIIFAFQAVRYLQVVKKDAVLITVSFNFREKIWFQRKIIDYCLVFKD